MKDWNHLLAELSKRNLVPKKIVTSEWYSWHIVSSFNSESSDFISESVSMGISQNPDIAIRKSITEFCERSFIKSSNDPIAHLTERSDGFAAYPALDDRSQNIAAENALNEAVERYLWAMWWDFREFKFKISNYKEDSLNSQAQLLISEFNLHKIEVVEITDKDLKFILKILVATNQQGGTLTGGACEKLPLINSTQINLNERAFGELLRHLLAYEKIKKTKSSKLSFYEQRLFGFASGQWKSIVSDRFKNTGTKEIKLPPLIANSKIKHQHSDLIHLHRCLFTDQPTFIGGLVDRLCI
jgi:hypothetical protein